MLDLKEGVSRRDSRRRGSAYPVKTQWQAEVMKRLQEMGWTKKDLARKIGCAPSTMTETLTSADARHSTLVPAIHAAIGWDPPPDPQSPPLPSADAIEMGHLFDRLPEEARRKLRDDAEFYLRMATSATKR